MTNEPVKTGDIVLLRRGYGNVEDAVLVPAVVLITHEDWSPGYHDAQGTWVPNSTIAQPHVGTVHLLVFNIPNIPVQTPNPAGIPGAVPLVFANVAEGQAVGEYIRKP